MCCDNTYTSKYRKNNAPSVLKKGECICDCKFVRSFKQVEPSSPTSRNVKTVFTFEKNQNQ